MALTLIPWAHLTNLPAQWLVLTINSVELRLNLEAPPGGLSQEGLTTEGRLALKLAGTVSWAQVSD